MILAQLRAHQSIKALKSPVSAAYKTRKYSENEHADPTVTLVFT